MRLPEESRWEKDALFRHWEDNMPAKVKDMAEAGEKAPPEQAVEKQPEGPEKAAGPMPIFRAAVAPQPSPVPKQHTEELLINAGSGLGAPARARTMTALQKSVGNARVNRAPSAMVQTKLAVSSPADDDEQEAEQVASAVMRMPSSLASSPASSISPSPPAFTPVAQVGKVQRQEQEESLEASLENEEEPDQTEAIQDPTQDIQGGGQPMLNASRAFFEPRFGQDFSKVRIHTDARAATVAATLNARAFTVGQHVVFGSGQYQPESEAGKKLMAHELTHVVQQGQAGPESEQVQRTILMEQPGRAVREMTRRERRRFARRHFRRSRGYELAKDILEDMASAADQFRFSDASELETEVAKRIATSRLMVESQTAVGGEMAFGYPFTSPSLYWGPRVNFAARDYWAPAVVDNYSRRTDPAERRRIEQLPRRRRHEVFGDPPRGYSWVLTPAGRSDPFSAIVNLFVPQSPRKRTLIHCDYLVSLVHYRSFANAVGRAEFNRRLIAFGVEHIRLKWNAFDDLQLDTVIGGGRVPGIGSLQIIRPSSPRDLVIGDHVYFWNHRAYGVINKGIGNAWRLENAVLIQQNRRGEDIFLGHGSGRRTRQQMKEKLAQEYNEVVRMALRLIARTRSMARREGDQLDSMRFPEIKYVRGEWKAQGTNLEGVSIDEVIREIRPDEVIGLQDPTDLTQMYWVRRPEESR